MPKKARIADTEGLDEINLMKGADALRKSLESTSEDTNGPTDAERKEDERYKSFWLDPGEEPERHDDSSIALAVTGQYNWELTEPAVAEENEKFVDNVIQELKAAHLPHHLIKQVGKLVDVKMEIDDLKKQISNILNDEIAEYKKICRKGMFDASIIKAIVELTKIRDEVGMEFIHRPRQGSGGG